MTSGEWDLRALKALEEEEQKEFLALSQKSLFEPPSPPAQAKFQQQQQINAQHLIHSALTERERTQQQAAVCNAANAAANYMQFQAQQLLKLPTINEHHHQHQQYLIKSKGKGPTDNNDGGGGGKLKFTKVLSLSAQSLTNRFGVGGGSGLGGGGLKKFKKSSGSNSPSHNGSPLYTPPPTRRCNTLHYSQPQARKAFKTLQQLEKQKQERKQELLSKNRTLQRIAGTNKTYWKYGINSTANSITLQHQQKLKQRKSISSELESNTSDELGSEETQPIDAVQRIKEERELVKELGNVNVTSTDKSNLDKYNDNDEDDDDDGNTDIGSCSVPLASDSIEMMSLMLTAASTAVKTQPSIPHSTATAIAALQPPPDIAATSGTVMDLNGFPKYFTLNHHNLNATSSVFNNEDDEETVAYEAFHKMFSRRKSFSGEKMLRAQTLQRNSSLQHDNVVQQQHAVNKPYRNVNNRSLIKSSSVEAPLSSYLDFNINSTTIITNPLTVKNNNNKNNKSNLSHKREESLKRKLINPPANLLAMPYLATTTTTPTKTEQQLQQQQKTTICSPLCFSQLQQHILQNPAYHHIQQQALQLQQQSQHHLHQQHQQHQHHLQHLQMNGNNDMNVTATATTTPSSSLIVDNELEEHIKQCSCSCNHMGYGNSMDYQVSTYPYPNILKVFFFLFIFFLNFKFENNFFRDITFPIPISVLLGVVKIYFRKKRIFFFISV